MFGEFRVDITPQYLSTMQSLTIKIQRCTQVQAIKNAEINQSFKQSSHRGTRSLEGANTGHSAMNQSTKR